MNKKRLKNASLAFAILGAVVLVVLLVTKPWATKPQGAATPPPATGAATQSTTGKAATTTATTTSRPLVEIELDKARREFAADLEFLTRPRHRLAGYGDPNLIDANFPASAYFADPNNGSAPVSLYVEKRLRQIGIPEVYVQTFPVVQPMTTQCRLFVDGNEVLGEADEPVIYPCRPNLLQGAITPAKGISGQTLYARGGEVSDYGVELPEGKIVVLDWECEKNWLKAFAFGAKAVVFVGSDSPAGKAWHHVNVPANLPRFYVPAKVAAKLELKSRPRSISVQAACQWKELRGRNVVGVIRGGWPRFGEKDQAFLLAVPLDSLSEVPDVSPGARDAANIAGLLQTASFLLRNPPRRDIILCFFDAQAQNHMGTRAFYSALYRELKGVTADKLQERIDTLRKERQFREKILAVVSQPEIFTPEARRMDEHAEAHRILQSEADGLGSEILDDLRPLRILRSELQRELTQVEKELSGPGRQEAEKKLNAMKEELARLEREITPLTDDDMGWNRVGKALHDAKTLAELEKDVQEQVQQADETTKAKKLKELTQVKEKMPQLLKHARGLQEQRIRELDQLLREADQANALKNALGPDRDMIMLHVSFILGDAREKWTFVHGDDSAPIDEDKSGNYSAVFNTMEDVYWDRVETNGGANHRGKVSAQLPDRIELVTEAGKSVAVNRGDVKSFKEGIWPVATAFDTRAVSKDYSTSSRLFCPGLIADSGAVARIFAIFNVSAVTVMDRLPAQGQPMDTVASLKPAAIFEQSRQIGPFLKLLADHPDMNVTNRVRPDVFFNETEWSGVKSDGPTIKRTGAGSAMSDRPVRDAMVALLRRTGNAWSDASVTRTPPGFDAALTIKTNSNGQLDVPPLSQKNFKNSVVLAATFDEPSVGEKPAPGDPVSRGLITAVTNNKTLPCGNLERAAIDIFRARSKTVVGYGFDRGAIGSIAMRSRSTARFRDDRHMVVEWENVLTLYATDDSKGFKVFNKAGMALLDNANNKDEYVGKGISLDDPFDFPITPRLTAHDMRVLNEYRLNLLRDNRINPESLDVLQGKAKDLEEDALAARGERPLDAKEARALPAGGEAPAPAGQAPTRPTTAPALARAADEFYGGLAAAAAYSRRTYIPLVGVMNDLVTAVVLLLLLAMPFAYALERLLIGTPHIYRQIAWFALFFALTFGILYFVNPAFRIAATPIIIFLAFAIILLSCLVIFIMVRKLQTEIKRMQGLATTVHSADVSRLSTMMAAVNMGISTMRRRPLRTLLTAITVVLLTFTILTFASFGSSWGPRVTYEGPMSDAPPRVLVRHQLWGAIGEGIYDVVRGHLAGEARVVPRWWVSPTAQEAQNAKNAGITTDLLVATSGVERVTSVAAAIGMDYTDITRQDLLRDMIDGDPNWLRGEGIFLTEAVRDEIQGDPNKLGRAWAPLVPGKSKVLLAGVELTFAGTIKDKLAAHTMLEGSSVLPVDYHASSGGALESFTQQQTAGETLSEMPDIESAQFVSYNLDKVVMISPQTARLMRGNIRALNIYPEPGRDIQDIAHRVACVTELPTYVGDQGGVYRLIFTSLAQASGWRDLLVPVLLGGLIIFATMLGSVSDREKEIYTFSSLGLAPPHIASLFFAEASMYAVIGGMGGYLLGQVVARVLGWMSNLGWVSVPNMNYSSTNAIVTILIVMGTVLISTIYPAVKASRSANPGIQRQWKIPKPQGNLYDLVFPFTVSAYDITGVVSFLKEHFDNFSDTALGCFATTDSTIIRQKKNQMLGFRATVALAPFDLGVNQSFALLSQPSDIEGIDEVRIMIYRLSGAGGDWQRSNRVFINDLRKQLLIWRSLPDEVMEKYRNKTLEVWNRLPVEDADLAIAAGEGAAETAGGTA